MKSILPFILLSLVFGCAAQKPKPVLPVAALMPPTIVSRTLVHAPADPEITTAITLIWRPWTTAPEVTVIVASPDLTIPRSQWKEVWRGSGASATVPTTNAPQMFYTVYNITGN